jgi:hypothetical protein
MAIGELPDQPRQPLGLVLGDVDVRVFHPFQPRVEQVGYRTVGWRRPAVNRGTFVVTLRAAGVPVKATSKTLKKRRPAKRRLRR